MSFTGIIYKTHSQIKHMFGKRFPRLNIRSLKYNIRTVINKDFSSKDDVWAKCLGFLRANVKELSSDNSFCFIRIGI